MRPERSFGCVLLHNHPYAFMRLLKRALPAETVFEFSSYRYEPQTLEDRRHLFTVVCSEFDREWFETIITQRGHGEEVALHSRVRIPGTRELHIPMIDFATSSLDELAECAKVFKELRLPQPYIFSSGRSYHGYVATLVDTSTWVRFMGALLLCNRPGRPEIVDSRWVGHRLIAGYSALRWTQNTSQYLSPPRRVRTGIRREATSTRL